MEIHLDPKIADQDWAIDAKNIVRTCVHCGFCNATCPTYQLLGHESDGPRGRVYLIKQLLEGKPADEQTANHLDRCLTCRSCESTCPSGVRYAQLLDTGRHMVDQQRRRHGMDWLKRKALTQFIPDPKWLNIGTRIAKPVRGLLPASVVTMLPAKGKNLSRPTTSHKRKMLLLEGCAQSSLTPETNAAAARILDKLGVMLVSESTLTDSLGAKSNIGCCGAVRLHTSERDKGIEDIKQRIDSWWPYIQTNFEAIVSTASGCGVTIKEYGELLKHDPEYAQKAAHISSMTADLSEIVANEAYAEQGKTKLTRNQATSDKPDKPALRVVFHSPCSLQHGQKIVGIVESLLHEQGYTLLAAAEGHLCCGSAGTYSVLQPEISKQLKDNKLSALLNDSPDIIATANVGCQLHLRADSSVPVVHWIELLDENGSVV